MISVQKYRHISEVTVKQMPRFCYSHVKHYLNY
jgi:hypothetical protein